MRLTTRTTLNDRPQPQWDTTWVLPDPLGWFSPWDLGQLSEVYLTPEQLEVMALRIRRYFGQPDERPSA